MLLETYQCQSISSIQLRFSCEYKDGRTLQTHLTLAIHTSCYSTFAFIINTSRSLLPMTVNHFKTPAQAHATPVPV